MGWFNRLVIRIVRKRMEVIKATLELKRLPDRSIEVWRLRLKLRSIEDVLEDRIQRELVEMCRTVGCDMKSVGGCNAGCSDDCCCSVPVHKCNRCGGYDYGENEEADEIRRQCVEIGPRGKVMRAVIGHG